MGRRLATFVHIPLDGAVHSYGPDDDVPADHAALITNEDAWAAGDDEDKPKAPRKTASK